MPSAPSATESQADADLAFAHRLADAARRVAAPLFRAGLAGESKLADSFDPVTEADQRVEAAMRDLIARERPGEGVRGEEGHDVASASGRWWVIDPIDGTRAFLAGLPTWCVLIALVDETGPTVSVIDQPHTGERFSGLVAGARREAWLERGTERRRLAARTGTPLESAIVSTTDPYLFSGDEAAAFEALRRRAAIARYGLDAYGYAALALGGVDVVVESGLKAWDVAALVPVVQGAGGVITDWSGGPCHEGGQVIAAADSALHAEALALLAGAAA